MMAKRTGLNGMMKWIIWIATAIFALGAMGEVIRSNRNRIEKVEVKAESNANTIIGIEKDIQYIREGIDDLRER